VRYIFVYILSMKTESILSAIIVVLATIILFGSGYLYGANPAKSPVLVSTPTPTISTTLDTSDWKTYTDEELGFSFKYPAEMKDISIQGQDKLFLRGDNQPEYREVIDGLMVIIDTSIPKSESLFDDVFNHLSDFYSGVEYDDLISTTYQGKSLIISTVGGSNDQIYRLVFQVDQVYLNITFAIGQYDQDLYRTIRNSIIDSIEFVE